MADFFGIGFNERNRRYPHPVGIVRQTEAQAEMDHIEQNDKNNRAEDRPL